jgi:hypothetical protein
MDRGSPVGHHSGRLWGDRLSNKAPTAIYRGQYLCQSVRRIYGRVQLFLAKPHLRPCFYASAPGSTDVPSSGPTSDEIETMCELMTGLLEHAALQQMNIPGNIWQECWEEYTNARFNESPAMRSYWKRCEHLYAGKFRAVVAARKGAAVTSSS